MRVRPPDTRPVGRDTGGGAVRSRRIALQVAAGLAAAVTVAACGGSSSTSTGAGTKDKVVQEKSSAGNQLVVLADDQHLQTADNVVPVVQAKLDTPPLEQALNGVTKVMTTDDLVALNKQADVERKTPA